MDHVMDNYKHAIIIQHKAIAEVIESLFSFCLQATWLCQLCKGSGVFMGP